MARNHEKYDYTELALPRQAMWYHLLEKEAEVRGSSIPRIILERLAKSYLADESFVAGEQANASPPSARQFPAPPLPPPLPTLGKAQEIPVETTENIMLDERQAQDNVAAYLSSESFF